MKICVVGWDYNEQYIRALEKVDSRYPVTIINHRPELPAVMLNGLVLITTENIGLEFGAYDYYLKTIWDRKSPVLFTHDDTQVSSDKVFDEIAELDIDQAYIWRDSAERQANGGKHGRAIYCSEKYLNFILNWECNCPQARGKRDKQRGNRQLKGTGPHRGFWFDPKNTGHTGGSPPKEMRHYNDAVYHFHWMAGRIRDQKVGVKELWPNPAEPVSVLHHKYFPGFRAGRRNSWAHIDREIARYGNAS